MFKKTAIAGLIPALVVTAVLMVALTIPAGASRPSVFSTSCDGSPYGRATANITAAPASPQHESTSVVLTATSTGCTNPEYRFFLMKPGGAWVAQGGYAGPSFVWNTTGDLDGIWGIGVWVRQIGSTRAYAAYAIATYRILANCLSASITTAPVSPATKGTLVTMTGSSTQCRLPLYRFWVQVKGVWLSFGNYSSTPTKIWVTGSYHFPKGRYMLGVWAKQVGSIHRYDSYALITFCIV
jgi:hypothetical protein